mgnify:CR=1 FL=1
MKTKLVNGIEVHRGSGNIFADLGLADGENQNWLGDRNQKSHENRWSQSTRGGQANGNITAQSL